MPGGPTEARFDHEDTMRTHDESRRHNSWARLVKSTNLVHEFTFFSGWRWGDVNEVGSDYDFRDLVLTEG